jgi:hypothetical protein
MVAGFGWDLETAHADGRLVLQHVPLGELDLDILATGIRRELAQGSIHRVVIDSLAELVFAAGEAERFPAYARSLTGLIRAAGATLLITSETTTLGPHPRTGWRRDLPVPQPDPAALHRTGIRHRPGPEHRQDAQQRSPQGRTPLRHRRTRHYHRRPDRRGHRSVPGRRGAAGCSTSRVARPPAAGWRLISPGRPHRQSGHLPGRAPSIDPGPPSGRFRTGTGSSGAGRGPS